MLALLVAASVFQAPASTRPFLHMPSVDSFAKHDPFGTTILPEGRLMRPAGWPSPVNKWPHGLAVSPVTDLAFVASERRGAWIDQWPTRAPQVSKFDVPEKDSRANSGAVAFSPDGQLLYWSSGETGGVYVYDVASRTRKAFVSLNVETSGRKFEDSFVNDLQVSADGRFVYCADFTSFSAASPSPPGIPSEP
jgi:DNA-binding beta-propeller fold protein YncE